MTDFELKVTRDKVFAACDAMMAKSIKPTQQLLKEALGGGSFTSISPLFREWKSAQQQVMPVAAAPVPETLKKAMDMSISQIWALAQEASEATMAGEREALHVAAQELAERESEMLEEITGNEKELNRLDSELSRLKEGSAAAAQEFSGVRAGLEQEVMELKVEKARNEETLKGVREQLEKNQAALDKANELLEVERRSVRTQEAKLGEMHHELDVAKGQLDLVNSDLETANKAHQEARSQAKLADEQLKKNLEENLSLKQQLSAQEARSEAHAQGLQKMMEQLQGQLDEERDRRDKLQNQLVEIAKHKPVEPVEKEDPKA